MKKSTLLIGVIASFLLLIGVFFRILHWPGGGTIMTCAAAIFAFGYAIMLYIDKSALAQNSFQRFVNIMTMLAMIIIMLSFLFKVQHWPFSGEGIFISHLLLLVMIPVLFLQASKESDPVKKLNFNNIAILFVVLTAFSFYIWLRIGANS